MYIAMRYSICTIYRIAIYALQEKGDEEMYENIALTEATYYILLSLYTPQHGYGIMQKTETLSKGRVKLAAGTLYGALSNMCEKEWIVQLPVEEGSRKKEYKLTETGLGILKNELKRLSEMVEEGKSVLKEAL